MFKFKQSLVASFVLAILFALATLFAFAGERSTFEQVEDFNAQNAREKKTDGSQLYSARISALSIPGQSTVCTRIPVPEGKRLVIDTVLLSDVTTTQDLPVGANIRLIFESEGMGILESFPIPLTPSVSGRWDGHLQTRIVSGPVTVGDGVVILDLCATRADVRGYIFGHLLPL